MQKHILFICSMMLCAGSLTAQLKEKMASFTRSLNHVQKFISKPSGPSPKLPVIDINTIGQAYFYIFKGVIATPENLKDFLLGYGNYDITIKQAQELYTAWKSKIEKRSLEKLLPQEVISKILKNIASGLTKSPEDLQMLLKSEGYLGVTLEQAKNFYEQSKIPTLPPPAPPSGTGNKITVEEGVKIIQEARIKGEKLDDAQEMLDYLKKQKFSLSYSDARRIADTIATKKPTTRTGKPERTPLGNPAVSIDQAVEFARTAIAAGVAKNYKAIFDYLKANNQLPFLDTTQKEVQLRLEIGKLLK